MSGAELRDRRGHGKGGETGGSPTPFKSAKLGYTGEAWIGGNIGG